MSKRILIIEDEESIGNVFRKQLEEIGRFKVKVAGGGKEGIDLLEKEVPDVVLLDLVMPDVDGIDVLKHIQSNKEKFKDLPVIILTNVTSEETREEVGKFGIKGYIVKTNVLPDDLIAEINKAMK